MSKVFLGGTCNNSTWRDKLIPMLEIDYFNPVVSDWTEECKKEELKQREQCDYCLYVITPAMTGVYSIAEAVDDSNKRPAKTIFCVLKEELSLSNGLYNPYSNVQRFTLGQLDSLNQVGKMIAKNGGKYFDDLKWVAHYLNNEK